MNFFAFLSHFMVISVKGVIRHSSLVIANPSCESCRFFHNDQGSLLCKKYGEKNDLSGQIEFYNALLCRTDELRCGTVGKHFLKVNENDTMIR